VRVVVLPDDAGAPLLQHKSPQPRRPRDRCPGNRDPLSFGYISGSMMSLNTRTAMPRSGPALCRSQVIARQTKAPTVFSCAPDRFQRLGNRGIGGRSPARCGAEGRRARSWIRFSFNFDRRRRRANMIARPVKIVRVEPLECSLNPPYPSGCSHQAVEQMPNERLPIFLMVWQGLRRETEAAAG